VKNKVKKSVKNTTLGQIKGKRRSVLRGMELEFYELV
jgi:hypothetical protein